MDIREVVKQAMGAMTKAELVKLLKGKVDKSSVYRFLDGETTANSDKLGHIFDALKIGIAGVDQSNGIEGGPYQRIAELEERIRALNEFIESENWGSLWREMLWEIKRSWNEQNRPSDFLSQGVDHALLTGELSEAVQNLVNQRLEILYQMMSEPPKRGRPVGTTKPPVRPVRPAHENLLD